MATTLAGLGARKAAVLLVQLGKTRAASVLAHLNENEVEAITAEIARLDTISGTESSAVLTEFRDLMMAREHISRGGLAFAQQVLEQSLGSERAAEIIERLNAAAIQMPFQFLRQADPAQLRSFIVDEHPQVIALVLAHMTPDKASLLLSGLPPEQQAQVAHRIAVMDRTSPDIVRTVESTLERKLSSMLQPADMSRVGGLDPLVSIINCSDRATERQIVEGLEALDAPLADEVKSRMFMFEDIVNLDDRSVQQVLRQVETSLAGPGSQGCLRHRARQGHPQPVGPRGRDAGRGHRAAGPGAPHPGRGGPAGRHPHDPSARGARRDHGAARRRR